jgi:hypothetical protein
VDHKPLRRNEQGQVSRSSKALDSVPAEARVRGPFSLALQACENRCAFASQPFSPASKASHCHTIADNRPVPGNYAEVTANHHNPRRFAAFSRFRASLKGVLAILARMDPVWHYVCP